jgi:hypothetical protein
MLIMVMMVIKMMRDIDDTDIDDTDNCTVINHAINKFYLSHH